MPPDLEHLEMIRMFVESDTMEEFTSSKLNWEGLKRYADLDLRIKRQLHKWFPIHIKNAFGRANKIGCTMFIKKPEFRLERWPVQRVVSGIVSMMVRDANALAAVGRSAGDASCSGDFIELNTATKNAFTRKHMNYSICFGGHAEDKIRGYTYIPGSVVIDSHAALKGVVIGCMNHPNTGVKMMVLTTDHPGFTTTSEPFSWFCAVIDAWACDITLGSNSQNWLAALQVISVDRRVSRRLQDAALTEKPDESDVAATVRTSDDLEQELQAKVQEIEELRKQSTESVQELEELRKQSAKSETSLNRKIHSVTRSLASVTQNLDSAQKKQKLTEGQVAKLKLQAKVSKSKQDELQSRCSGSDSPNDLSAPKRKGSKGSVSSSQTSPASVARSRSTRSSSGGGLKKSSSPSSPRSLSAGDSGSSQEALLKVLGELKDGSSQDKILQTLCDLKEIIASTNSSDAFLTGIRDLKDETEASLKTGMVDAVKLLLEHKGTGHEPQLRKEVLDQFEKERTHQEQMSKVQAQQVKQCLDDLKDGATARVETLLAAATKANGATAQDQAQKENIKLQGKLLKQQKKQSSEKVLLEEKLLRKKEQLKKQKLRQYYQWDATRPPPGGGREEGGGPPRSAANERNWERPSGRDGRDWARDSQRPSGRDERDWARDSKRQRNSRCSPSRSRERDYRRDERASARDSKRQRDSRCSPSRSRSVRPSTRDERASARDSKRQRDSRRSPSRSRSVRAPLGGRTSARDSKRQRESRCSPSRAKSKRSRPDEAFDPDPPARHPDPVDPDPALHPDPSAVAPPPPKQLYNWSRHHVSAWLESVPVGLEVLTQYACSSGALRNGTALVTVTEDQLRELGIEQQNIQIFLACRARLCQIHEN
jgi:hypothetical protein